MHATAPTTAGEDHSPDIATMRATVERVLDPDAAPDVLPPAGEELDMLITLLRSQLEVIVPEVQDSLSLLSKNDVHRYCMLGCIGEARQKLRIGLNGASHEVRVALARKLARSVDALCNHYEHLQQLGAGS